jgi:GT2 family glycosyltransferase
MKLSKKNRPPVRHSLVDIALLTAGYVDIPVFRECISAIKREMATVDSAFYAFRDNNPPESRQAYDEIFSTIPNAKIKHHSGVNVGFPRGANTAIRAGTSPLVFFVSDDIILHEGTLMKLVRTMDDPQIAMCGLKLIFPEDSPDPGRPAGRVQHIGHAVDIRGEITHPLLGWRPDNPKTCVSREVQSVTGAAFMVRRSAFLKAGGFFEGYGKGYFEDVDLNLTLRSMGHKVWINADATATHYTGYTFRKKQEPTNMQGNRMLLLQRKGNLLVNDSFTFW